MFAVATANSTVFIDFYLYLHDLCVSCVCFAVCFCVFYVYMGQVPEIKLMMMMMMMIGPIRSRKLTSLYNLAYVQCMHCRS